MTERPRVPSRAEVPGEVYVVLLRGRLGSALIDVFSPLVATLTDGRTSLCGPIEDQAALHGILAKIQN